MIRKNDIVRLVAIERGLAIKDVKVIVDDIFEHISKELEKEDGHVKIHNFGTMSVVKSKEREAINLTTKEKILVPSKFRVKFKSSKALKERINSK